MIGPTLTLADERVDTNNPGTGPSLGSAHPRDSTYYFEDGNTVLLVGGVLFKVIAIFKLVY